MSSFALAVSLMNPAMALAVFTGAVLGFCRRGEYRLAERRRFLAESLFLWAGFLALRVAVGVPLAFAIYGYLHRFAFFDLPLSGSSGLLCFVAVDFLYYWRHRLEHRAALLWADHGVHHSVPEFNLTTALQLPWFAVLYDWIYSVPLALLGFAPELIVACLVLNLFLQTWSHLERVGPLPKLDWLLATPANHRLHHYFEAGTVGRNFGAVFMLWDKGFGTYVAPRAEPVKQASGEAVMPAPALRRVFGPVAELARRALPRRGPRGR